jgi:hypothetical protein
MKNPEKKLTERRVRLPPKLRRLLIEAVSRSDGRILVSIEMLGRGRRLHNFKVYP